MPPVISNYDPVADYYERAWAGWYGPSVRPALKRLLFSVVPAGGLLLDACCGCGHVTRELLKEGYAAVGFDLSRELVFRAASALPEAAFFVADARYVALRPRCDGAISTFDSLNHLLTIEELEAALRGIHSALKPGAPFFFDMNLSAAYLMDLNHWTIYQEDSAVGFVRGRFDASSGRAQTELVWFAREGSSPLWRRSDTVVLEQCYSREEIQAATLKAGFRRTEFYSPEHAGVTDELGFGRTYVRAWA
jgi:SAM-dependent methyltransferase